MDKAHFSPALRSYGRRWLRMAPPAFLLSFTILFFGPLDIINTNGSYLPFSAGDLFWPLLGLALGSMLLLSALAALLPGRSGDVALGLLFALALMAYVQGVFLGGHLMTLDGSSFRWQEDAPAAWRNLALWAAALAGLSLLSLRFPAGLRTAAVIGCAALCLAQATALAATWTPKDPGGTNYQLDGSEQFVLSEEGNVVVITLDQMSPALFEGVLALDPALEDEFRDFLYYDNMAAAYSRTFPSLCYLFTGEEYDGSIGCREYLTQAWHSEGCEAFYDLLEAEGYQANFYVKANYAALNTENMLGKAHNAVAAGELRLGWPLLKKAVGMSLFRYCPTMLKNPFCISTAGLYDAAEYDGIDPICISDNFYPALQQTGLRLEEGSSRLVWHHLKGAHYPYTVGYDGLPLEGEEAQSEDNQLLQLHGFLTAAADYLAQMKALGVYDEATIILSADHGTGDCQQAAFLIKAPGQSFDRMQYRHAPVHQGDIRATILDCLGLDYSAFGLSVFDVAEDAVRLRCTALLGYSEDYPEAPWIGSQGDSGDDRYNILGLVYYSGGREELLEKQQLFASQLQADEIRPMQDSFY